MSSTQRTHSPSAPGSRSHRKPQPEEPKFAASGTVPSGRRLKAEDVIKAMKPGVRYGTLMLAEHFGQTVHAINPVLAQLANAGRVWQMPGERSSVYWIPTPKEIAAFAERRNRRITWNKGTLQGYDEQHRTFRELCMLARHS